MPGGYLSPFTALTCLKGRAPSTQEYAGLADGDPVLGDLRAHGISAGVSICADFTAETRAHASARYSRYQYLFHCCQGGPSYERQHNPRRSRRFARELQGDMVAANYAKHMGLSLQIVCAYSLPSYAAVSFDGHIHVDGRRQRRAQRCPGDSVEGQGNRR